MSSNDVTMERENKLEEPRYPAWWSRHSVLLYGSAGAVLLFALVYPTGWLAMLLYTVVTVGLLGFGFLLGLFSALNSGPQYQPDVKSPQSIANLLLSKMMEKRLDYHPPEIKIVISHNMDAILQELMDLVHSDYIYTWYQTIGQDDERFKHVVQKDTWILLKNLTENLKNIDLLTFVTQDIVNVVNEHFYDIRMATKKDKSDVARVKFQLLPYLCSPEREQEFLRKVAECFLIFLLPDTYKKAHSIRHLLREILVCQVLQPTVDKMCDPDYINQVLYNWYDYREGLVRDTKRTYTYAATYEDFIKMIMECEDVEHLKQMRYNIISEIMQATTIDNIKRAKGPTKDKESSRGTSKGDLLRARNLKRYINQLRIAKARCEKRIHLLGGPDFKSYDQDQEHEERGKLRGSKILSFAAIMETPVAREYLMKYLHGIDCEGLLGYWMAVEHMKQSRKRHWHQMAGEIYQMYLASTSSSVRMNLDRGTIKNMEAFMMGNKGPDAFYEAQESVYHLLEEKYYPSFILTDIYHQFIRITEEEQQDATPLIGKGSSLVKKSLGSPLMEEARKSPLSGQSTYSQVKLKDLDEKITNKVQALQALRHTQRSKDKIKKLQEELEGEIDELRREKRELESYMERSNMWSDSWGKWRASIQNTEIMEETGKRKLYFVILVHLLDEQMQAPSGGASPKQGWVIMRRLEDFHWLYSTLTEINPELKRQGLEKCFKQKRINDAFVTRARPMMQEFISVILTDRHLELCEALFTFFCNNSEQTGMMQGTSGNRQTLPKRSLTTEEDEGLLFSDEEGRRIDVSKDSIAEPLYRLIGEVYELQGVFKWLRRTLITFVQVSFGRTINRQLRETVDWIFSEPMLIYYLRTLRDSFWVNGELAPPAPPRTDEEKLQTRMLAKEKFVGNVPDALKSLLGDKSSKQGAIKVFECLQDVRLNKHLFYKLLEVFLAHLFPEFERLLSQEEHSDNEEEQDDTEHNTSAETENVSSNQEENRSGDGGETGEAREVETSGGENVNQSETASGDIVSHDSLKKPPQSTSRGRSNLSPRRQTVRLNQWYLY